MLIEWLVAQHGKVFMTGSVGQRWLVLLALVAVSPETFGHGGGLDARGCHNDGSTGQYHCHQGDYAGQTFDSESALKEGQRRDEAGAGPSSAGYDRDDYHSSWQDQDGDCRDTREEVLIEESRVPVQFASSRECDVVAGRWRDPYSGEVFTDPSKLDIDHLVPLKEAHKSGASEWPDHRKHSYANDLNQPHTLIAVSASENRSKGANDPADWLPSNKDFHCEYIARWLAVKQHWDLDMNSAEQRTIRRMESQCPELGS